MRALARHTSVYDMPSVHADHRNIESKTVIGRRREDPIKRAQREAKVVDSVQRSLRIAGVREHPIVGGTLLTEPVLVFHGEHRQDLRVFDRDSKELGVARWRSEKAAGFDGYRIYGADDEVPLVVINWSRGWLSGSGNYTVLDSERVIAALCPQRIRFTSGLGIMVGGERIGYLSPSGLRWGHVNDNEGREVARIKDIGWVRCYVGDIEPSLAGPLRAVPETAPAS
jgi:hypothetical protein